MPQTLYCWRCRMELPMLTEQEWKMVASRLPSGPDALKVYADQRACSINEARKRKFGEVLEAYERVTGFKETNIAAIFHHRLSLYGPPCARCGKPLRTPRARICAACGADRA